MACGVSVLERAWGTVLLLSTNFLFAISTCAYRPSPARTHLPAEAGKQKQKQKQNRLLCRVIWVCIMPSASSGGGGR